jgi:hypothetical protein
MLALAAPAAAADVSCRRSFRSADRIITALSIGSTVFGDFNEDGRTDLAFRFVYNVRLIALNRGEVFQPLTAEYLRRADSDLFDAPLIAAANVNDDGHLDLIYRQANVISVAFGRGDGTFQPLVHTTLPGGSVFWRAIDFDHDGRIDFVDVDSKGAFAFVRSNGDGSFAVVGKGNLSLSTSENVNGSAGDFDGDGNVDVLRFAIGLNSMSLTFGWNDGAYRVTETRVSFGVRFLPQPVDVDGDGAEDLVGIDAGSLVVLHARNRSLVVERFPVASEETSLLIRDATMIDADHDGIRDLVFSSQDSVGIVWGASGGGFRDATFYELRGQGLALVDLDGDAVPDFVSTRGHDGLAVLDGAAVARGLLNASRVYPTGFTPAELELADVDGDGVRDLVATSGEDFTFRAAVLFGSGRGDFSRPSKSLDVKEYAYGRSFAGDFDGDGAADLAVTRREGSGWAGTAAPMIAFGGKSGLGSTTLRLDADFLYGRVYLGASSPPVLIAGKGDDIQLVTISSGRIAASTTIYRRPPRGQIVVVRSSPDVEPQFLVVSDSEKQVIPGTLQTIRLVARRSLQWTEMVVGDFQYANVNGASSGDFDRDGRNDLALWDTPLGVLLAQSDGSYKSAVRSGYVSGYVDSMTAVDFDRDGWLDIVETTRGSFGDPGTAAIVHNIGGSFDTYTTTMTAAPFRQGVIVDDIDGDGWPDLVIPSFDGAEVLLNECQTPRIRVAVVPGIPPQGTQATLVINALSTNGYVIGPITVRDGNKVVATNEFFRAYDLATMMWTTPPLSAGTHTYRIEYRDQHAGLSTVTVDIKVPAAVPRRRSVHR